MVLRERNLKYADNRYIDLFEAFIKELDSITIKEVIDVPIIKKLVHLHNKEANVKAFIIALANVYEEKISIALNNNTKKKAKNVLSSNKKSGDNETVSNMERMKELAKTTAKTNRALFSEETTRRVLNRKTEQ